MIRSSGECELVSERLVQNVSYDKGASSVCVPVSRVRDTVVFKRGFVGEAESVYRGVLGYMSMYEVGGRATGDVAWCNI
jgi:hypothetical protein